MKEKTLTSTLQYEGRVFTVTSDTALTDDGQVVHRDVVHHGGGVGIALENEKGEFYFVRQYRYGIGQETIEFPAGKKEKGEDPLETAKREIQEETGFCGKGWQYLGQMVVTPAYVSERIDMYYAKVDHYVGMHLDEDERVEGLTLTLEALLEKIARNEIIDAKTMVMALLLKQKKEKGLL